LNVFIASKRVTRGSAAAAPGRLLVVGLVIASTGCVKSSKYHQSLAELAASQAQTASTQRELEQTSARLQQQLADVTAEKERTARALADAEARIRQLESENLTLENDRNRLTTQIGQGNAAAELLRTQVERLSELERELNQRNQEINERNRIYQDVIERFRSLIAGGQLSVSISRGRLVINLPQDILFASGSATIGRDGKSTLTQVAKVLADIPDRQFQVEGHTDDKRIQTAQFPSNWELSTARAISVVRLLQDEGVKPENISAAGFGEFRPVASNADDAGRRLNRRIEIVMVPNLDVIAGGLPPK
jgi:chemotaxis protein MotB